MKTLIAFRADEKHAEEFAGMVAALGTSDSELARRAYNSGIAAAYESLATEKRQEAQALIARLSPIAPKKAEAKGLEDGQAAIKSAKNKVRQ